MIMRTAFAQVDAEKRPELGSNDQNYNREAVDDSVKISILDMNMLEPFDEFKRNLYRRIGLDFDFDYNSLYIASNSSMGEGKAAGGVFRFYGIWDVIGRKSGNKGGLIFKLEQRHKYTAIPVIDLSMDMGNVGIYGVTFNNNQFRVTNLYWEQRLFKGRLILLLGFLDATDFFDVYALGSPWAHFNNLNFTTGLSVASMPGDGYLGFSAGGWLSKRIYSIAGFGDQNSDPSHLFQGFDTFFNQHEFFKFIEIGYSLADDYVFSDNIHLSFWHIDNDHTTGTGWGWGWVFSATDNINKKWQPFLKASYSEKGNSLLESALSIGLGYMPKPDGHQLGIGCSWGRPNSSTLGYGLNDQYLIETFYRVQLSKKMAFTPGVMYVIHPALNPNQNSIIMWSLRARIVL